MRMPTLFLALALANVVNGAPPLKSITGIDLDKRSFNVSTGDRVTVTLRFGQPGTASILVLDRDGYLVRKLASAQPIGKTFLIAWDGRNDAGDLVADEAYSFKVDWTDGKHAETYFPANRPASIISVTPRYYDRRSGTLSYVLSQPSRVHVQAGTAIVNKKTKAVEGPVMKTIVNREPRSAGAIAEHWNGFDESGSIFIPDLKNFVVAIAAEPLPENSVITFGNRTTAFVDALRHRKGKSLLASRPMHAHHVGLDSLNDLSPNLIVEPVNAKWLAEERVWVTADSDLKLRVKPTGPTVDNFMLQPAKLYRFIDGRLVGRGLSPGSDVVTVPLNSGKSRQLVSINWLSDWGPVAVNTVAVRREPAEIAERSR
jgi:flagellar hook assembly protein FlgD